MSERPSPTAKSDRWFAIILGCSAAFCAVLLLAMIAANVWVAAKDWTSAWETLGRAEIQQAIWLSIGTSLISTVISLWLGTAVAFLVARHQFKGRRAIDLLMDLPVFLPPLVIGISLLILFRQTPLKIMDQWLQITFQVPAIILAQSVVGVAFVYRTMKAVFNQQSGRSEAIAKTLGASNRQIFSSITLPASRHGLVAAAALAWARAFGEFGPVLVFAGSFRGRTEVLPVSIYLELNSGNLAGAAMIALLMVFIAAIVLLVVRIVAVDRSVR